MSGAGHYANNLLPSNATSQLDHTPTPGAASSSIPDGVPITTINGSDPSATPGQSIYRVYGGDSRAGGASWSPIDPSTVPNFRDAAGLPSGGASGATNTGQFVIEGTIVDPDAVVLVRDALPLDGMSGGASEYIIPNWQETGAIGITNVSGANPAF